MSDVSFQVQTALSSKTYQVEVILSIHTKDAVKNCYMRIDLAEQLVTQCLQPLAAPHGSEELTISLNDDSYPLSYQAAMTFGMLLLRAVETAKAENVLKRFLEEVVELDSKSALEMTRQFREFSARMAEDQFQRFD